MAYVWGLTTNRDYGQVDAQFGFRLGAELQKRAHDAFVVCDIACGPDATALTDILCVYPHARGIGLDYQARSSQSDSLSLRQGDVFDIPFSLCADVTYCAFLMADIGGDTHERRRRIAQATYQIAKTLMPGGVALIDEGTYTGRQCYLDFLVEEIEVAHPGFRRRFMVTNDPLLGLFGNHMRIQRMFI